MRRFLRDIFLCSTTEKFLETLLGHNCLSHQTPGKFAVTMFCDAHFLADSEKNFRNKFFGDVFFIPDPWEISDKDPSWHIFGRTGPKVLILD